MADTAKEDLRVQRAKEAIRKTFYLHYNTLDDLLRELRNEMAATFNRVGET